MFIIALRSFSKRYMVDVSLNMSDLKYEPILANFMSPKYLIFLYHAILRDNSIFKKYQSFKSDKDAFWKSQIIFCLPKPTPLTSCTDHRTCHIYPVVLGGNGCKGHSEGPCPKWTLAKILFFLLLLLSFSLQYFESGGCWIKVLCYFIFIYIIYIFIFYLYLYFIYFIQVP